MSKAARTLELTLAMIKPHILKDPTALKAVRRMILTSNFKIVRTKRHTFTVEEAEKFYDEHKGKFFYNRLVTFMTSGPTDLHILARDNAIKEWRRLMGPTKILRAQYEVPDSIRGRFALSDTRNAAHGSDSPESAKKEIGIFFPIFDLAIWYYLEEPHFRNGNVTFVESEFIHKV